MNVWPTSPDPRVPRVHRVCSPFARVPDSPCVPRAVHPSHILSRASSDPVSSPAPTLGFSRLEVRRRGWTVELYDVGGGRGIRGIWRNYLAESHGLAFVVDAADLARADECRDTLHALLADPRVAGKPVLM